MNRIFIHFLLAQLGCAAALSQESSPPPPQGDEPPDALVKSSQVFKDRFTALNAAKASVDRLAELRPRPLNNIQFVDTLRQISRLNLTAIYDESGQPTKAREKVEKTFPRFNPPSASFESDPSYQQNLAELAKEQALGNRVVGGGRAPAASYKWCVAILDEDDATFCSGTLIGSRLVLTARHCADIRGGPRSVYVGDAVGERTGQKYKVKRPFRFPPIVGRDPVRPDIMLLELEKDVVDAAPRAIAPSDVSADLVNYVRVVGFGRDQPPDDQGYARGHVGVKNVADVPLNRGSPDVLGFDQNFEFCAGLRGLNIDSCGGDSGGAALLYVPEKDRSYLYGAVSRSVKPQRGDTARQLCGNGGVYTRVDKFGDWIRAIATEVGTTLADPN